MSAHAHRLATVLIWTVAILLAIAAMAAEEGSRTQDRLLGASLILGGIGVVTYVGSA